ncbi:MAG: glycoside hydrolase, partial [Hymenobacter sp.]|nr:glycoside hydrolase [Hymenobacter sp.]
MEDLNQSNYSLSASRPDEHAVEDTANPLPRAVLRMNSHVLLDGQWNFAHDVEDTGLRDDWALGHTYEHRAQWPGSVEEHLAQARGQQSGATWHDKVVVWYEREFQLPEVAEPERRSMLQLTFGACGYETRVWLNGQLLKTIEGEEVHFGEYTSFTYELPEECLHLVNRLTVRIADTMDAETPRGKQESHVYKRGGIWYQTHTGAVRSTWLEVVERNRLRSRIGVMSVVEDQ